MADRNRKRKLSGAREKKEVYIYRVGEKTQDKCRKLKPINKTDALQKPPVLKTEHFSVNACVYWGDYKMKTQFDESKSTRTMWGCADLWWEIWLNLNQFRSQWLSWEDQHPAGNIKIRPVCQEAANSHKSRNPCGKNPKQWNFKNDKNGLENNQRGQNFWEISQEQQNLFEIHKKVNI